MYGIMLSTMLKKKKKIRLGFGVLKWHLRYITNTSVLSKS